MAAGPWTFTNTGRTSLLNGDFDLDTHSFRMALYDGNSNLGLTSDTYAGVSSELATANGYTATGYGISLSLTGTTKVTVDSTDAFWLATNTGISARFAAIYSSETGGKILCYCLLDSTNVNVTVSSGNTLTIAIHADGVFDLT